MMRPVAQVKELPKEPVKGVTYLVEGSRDAAKAKLAPAKRKEFAAGRSILATEDEINSLLAPLPAGAPPPAAAGKEKGKGGEKAPAAKAAPAPAANAPVSDDLLALGAPNLRISEGAVQVIVPMTINILGLGQRVMVAGTGNFVKKDGGFVFEASTLMIGSCPVQKIPMAAGFLAKRLITAKDVPEDIAGAWAKLADVAIEGSALKLTMP
jgi:hypothetical protein